MDCPGALPVPVFVPASLQYCLSGLCPDADDAVWSGAGISAAASGGSSGGCLGAENLVPHLVPPGGFVWPSGHEAAAADTSG